MMVYSEKDMARLWAKIEKSSENGCHIFTGTPNCRRPVLRVQGRNVYASRMVWEILCGLIPEGLVVCHNCPGGDNPRCVNVAHLFLGTVAENNADKIFKGTAHKPKGELHPQAKLTKEKVLEIRKLLADKIPVKKVAAQYSISVRHVNQIKSNVRWRHV